MSDGCVFFCRGECNFCDGRTDGAESFSSLAAGCGSSGDFASPKPAPVALEGKSKATSVEAMRKYREAKEKEQAASPVSRGSERAAPPPKIDLYK